MGTAFILLSMIPLGFMVVSDIKMRHIRLIWLILFGVMILTAAIFTFGTTNVFGNAAANLVFLALLYLFIWFYTAVIRRRAIGSPSGAIGSGDMLFLAVLVPFFDIKGFVGFLTASFILSLTGYYILRAGNKNIMTIPLVSTVGTCFIIYCGLFVWMNL